MDILLFTISDEMQLISNQFGFSFSRLGSIFSSKVSQMLWEHFKYCMNMDDVVF